MVRFKNRYVTIEISDKFDPEKALHVKAAQFQTAIQDKVQELYGDLGRAAIKQGFNAKYCNPQTRIAVVKVRHGPHKFVVNAIPLLDKIGKLQVNMKILYIGASLKHCYLFIRRHQQKNLEKMWADTKGGAKRAELQKALMTLHPSMQYFH